MDDDEILEGELVDDDQLSAQAELLSGAGLLSEEIDIFDIAATEGPAYELDGLSIDQIEEITKQLDNRGVRWAIDGNPQLLVHRNHERKADEVFDLIFGPEE
ncbi:MAG TPA: hypothetical protein DCY36_01545 [Acidimicrobiaceae bacterium]|nr:hypothetical protein [Acidimicrobiaceae bacterium]HAY64684.1 hypothetical protein [Acidimicrobiaceae bacterium]|tara:strand:+ start:118 stop:423 length:306 start_codon:yes stop_codon:yes gene_type:complete